MTDDVPVPRRALLLAAAFAALAALAVYAPTYLGGGYGAVNYDDPYLLGPQNPVIGKGLLGGLPDLLSPFRSPQFMNAWLPLYYASLGIDHALFGDAMGGFHLHSALLHALGAALVVAIGARLGLGVLGACVAGLLFAVHPAASENVAWIAGRKDVLAFVWMALATLAYLEGVRSGRARWHVVGGLCLVVSLTAKGTTLVLPALLALHALFLRRDEVSRALRLRPVVPYAVAAAAMTGLHLWVAAREGTAGGGGTSLGRILVADLDVAARYAFVLFTPLRQSVEHGIDPAAVVPGRLILGAAVLVAWAGFVFASRARPGRLAFLLALPLALAPFNNVLPRTSVLFAERYAHVALLPVVLGAGVLAMREGPRRLAGYAAVVAATLLTTLRLPVWSDSVALWDDAAAKAPESALVRMQLADAWALRGRTGDAAAADEARERSEHAWREALRLARDDLSKMRAESGLGTHLLTTAPPSGQTEERLREAVAFLDGALGRLDTMEHRDARSARIHVLTNRATAREVLGDREGALADWRSAAVLDPANAATLNGLARALLAAGLADEARQNLELSAKAAPTDPTAVRERARIRRTMGEVAAAKADLERALGAHPEDYDLLLDAAMLDASLLRPIDAERLFRRALAVRPDDPTARAGVAGALLEQAQAQAARDEREAARAAALAAAEIAPESSAPQQVLGIVARRSGDLEEATRRFRLAHKIHPEGVRIREGLASVLVERALAHLDGEASSEAAYLLLDEAVAVGSPSIATRDARLDRGTDGWPPRPPAGDAVATVARRQALLGLARLAAGRPVEAVPELEVAVRGAEAGDGSLRRVALRLLVRARFLSGLADEALAAADELAALPPGDEPPWRACSELASACIEAGIAARSRGDRAREDACFVRAQALLDEVPALGGPESERRLRRGEIFFAQERFLEATREFDAAIEAAPASVDAYLDRAAVWRTQFLLEEDRSFLAEAERDLRRALAASPSDPRAMAALGEVLVLATRPSEGWPWLQRALLADPSQAVARRILVELTVRAARTHLEKKEIAEARAASDRATALDAPTPDALLLRAEVFRSEGDLARAISTCETAAERYPGRVEPHAALARYYFDAGNGFQLLGKRDEAVWAFRKSLGIVQDRFDASPARERIQAIALSSFEDGLELRRSGKVAEAAARFRTSVLADPTREGWFQLGLALLETGDFDGAASAYSSALSLSPDWLPPLVNRAAALLRAGRWDEALTDYRALLLRTDLDPKERPRIERQVAWIEEQRSEMEDGRAAPERPPEEVR